MVGARGNGRAHGGDDDHPPIPIDVRPLPAFGETARGAQLPPRPGIGPQSHLVGYSIYFVLLAVSASTIKIPRECLPAKVECSVKLARLVIVSDVCMTMPDLVAPAMRPCLGYLARLGGVGEEMNGVQSC
jgi:hypothetical protein